jgi:hypothetical protein
MADLAEILGETPSETPAEIPVETETKGAEPAEAEAAPAENAEVEQVEAPEESPSTEPQEPAMVPAAVMHGERDRRQSLQKEFEEYKAQHPPQEEPKPDFYADPDAALNARDQQLSKELTTTLLNEGKGEAISQYDQETVDKAEQWFVEEAVKSPVIAGQLNDVPLLQQHRKVVELFKANEANAERIKDPSAYEAKLKQQGVEEYLAAQASQAEEKQKVTEAIPKSLVGDSSKGGIKGTEWSGPTPLESVIGEGG